MKAIDMKRLTDLRALHTRLMAVGVAVIAGAAGAQSTTSPADTGAAAVSNLGLDAMIAAFAGAVRTLVSENGTALALVILPVLAWYFIRNQLRGSI